MKKQEIQLAIAESLGRNISKKKLEHGLMFACPKCGTHRLHINDCGYSSFNAGSINCDCGYKLACSFIEGYPNYVKDWNSHVLSTIPNYTESLDACREFEEKLSSDGDNNELQRYGHALMNLVRWKVEGCDTNLWDEYGWYGLIKATPLQRCEAYLRTIGKWKE